MDEIFHLTLLFDFYGELLTEKQKEVFEMYHFNDLSLNEIGAIFNISPQSVSDMLKRSNKLMLQYEQKLQLVKKHIERKDIYKKIHFLIEDSNKLNIEEKQQLYKLINALVLI